MNRDVDLTYLGFQKAESRSAEGEEDRRVELDREEIGEAKGFRNSVLRIGNGR